MIEIKNKIVARWAHGETQYVYVSELHYGDVIYDFDTMWLVDTEPYIDNNQWSIGATAIGSLLNSQMGDK